MIPSRRVPAPPRSRSTPYRTERPVQRKPKDIAHGSRMVFAVAAGVYVILFLRLVWVQGVVAARFRGKSAVSRTKVVEVPTDRGRIYDRDMRVLVRNEPGFVLVVDPNAWFQNNKNSSDTPEARRDRLEAVLSEWFPTEWAERTPPAVAELRMDDRRRTADGKERFPTIDLVAWISPDVERELRMHGLSGLGFHPTTRRRAIDGTNASALLGNVSRYGVGLEGLEYRWNKTLAGKPRIVSRKSDLKGVVPGSELELRSGVPGKDLVLTLDSTLQHEAERELAAAVKKHRAEEGTVVVLDAATGDILAMAGCPTFDANDPLAVPAQRRRIAGAHWVFEPGSTMKTITLAGALESGTIVRTDRFACGQRLSIGKRKVSCSPHGAFQNGHGTPDVEAVLTHSCNVATARIALAMGADKMRRTLRDFGFGVSTRCGVPGEESGVVRDDWSKIRTANVGFGQGISVTPLQMVAAYTTFVDGVRRSPRIVRGLRDPRTGVIQDIPAAPPVRVLSEKTAATIREMLENVVVEGTGTPAALDRFAVGGKTGTAQIPGKGGYIRGAFFASFVGLAPIKAPRFVVLVSIKNPQGGHYGGSVAGPVFKRIMERALTLADVAPERAAKPSPPKFASVAD